MKKRIVLLITILVVVSATTMAQCVQCDEDETPMGINASRLGTETVATGHSAFASGYNSTASGNYTTAIGHNATASGSYSTALGYNVTASGIYSTAIGKFITASGSSSIVIGSGYSQSAKLNNNVSNSIMFGVGSSTPTMTIVHKSSGNVPAYIGIGTDEPKQMLHIVDGNILISRVSSNNTRAPGSLNGSILFGDITTNQYPFGAWGIEYLNDSENGYGLNFWKTTDANGTSINYVLFLCEEGSYKGNVGIGTKKPSCKLEVSGSAKTTSLQTGTLNVTGNVSFGNLAGNTTKIVTVGTDGKLNAKSGLFIADNGNVRIGSGTGNPSKALEVNGTIRSKEVIVEIANWSDFVFDNNYNLMSLKDTESFIKQNGHLPNVPSASEVESNGIQLGEMNAILLQKIEELTLYVIELEKKIEELKGDKE